MKNSDFFPFENDKKNDLIFWRENSNFEILSSLRSQKSCKMRLMTNFQTVCSFPHISRPVHHEINVASNMRATNEGCHDEASAGLTYLLVYKEYLVSIY